MIDPDVLGVRPTIEGHRIGVIHVATWIAQGMTPQGISDLYKLSLAEVYAALAYYHDHKEALDRQAAEDDARIAAYAANDQSPLAQSARERFHAAQKSTVNVTIVHSSNR
ncbi:MAG: DUF433 domain-containing protein [Ktedonobacterales bacterium]